MNTPMIYVTSDTHFNHPRDFLFAPRGFSSCFEHDEQVIKNWNSVVKSNDIVYHLGDLGMGTDYDYLVNCINRLNGMIYWIRGNHDGDKKVNALTARCPNLICVGYATMVKFRKYHFYLSHFPTAVGNYDDEEKHSKFYCLCGHSHCQDKWKDFHTMKSYHVELDTTNNFPISLEQIREEISKRRKLEEA